jgi:citrate synthase
MADTPKLVSSMGRAELDRIFVRNYDLNKDLLGKITFAQMVYLMIVGRMPTAEEGRMVDTMLIVLVDHGMTTGAAAARMTFHSAPEAIQGAVAAAILGAGSVHLGSSEHCAKMLNDALPKDSKESDLDAIALKTVEKRLANNQLIPGIGQAFTLRAIRAPSGCLKSLRKPKSTAATVSCSKRSARSRTRKSASICPST